MKQFMLPQGMLFFKSKKNITYTPDNNRCISISDPDTILELINLGYQQYQSSDDLLASFLGNNYPHIKSGIPGGLSWLADSISRFNIYAKGFVPRPTIFFDPSASSAGATGTFLHPYATEAQLYNAIIGNMAGQVLGFKRGTTLRTSVNGLRIGQGAIGLGVYGSSAAPFYMVPYGDALALPVITGGQVRTDWVNTSGNLWQLTGITNNSDVYQSDVRLLKTSGAPAAAGQVQWSAGAGGTLIIWPYSNENPNLGQVEITLGLYAMHVAYAKNVTNSGYITIAGLDLKKSRLPTLAIDGTASGTPTLAGFNVYGCRVGQSGADDAGGNYVGDGIYAAGVDDTHRLSGEIMGNEMYDCLNNALEVSMTDGLHVAYNYGHDVGGNSVIEMYTSNANILVEKNIGKRAGGVTRLHTWHASGIWATDLNAAGSADATRLINVGNTLRFNYIEDCASKGMDLASQIASNTVGNSICHHNSIVQRTYGVSQSLAFQLASGQTLTAPTPLGWDISNNLVANMLQSSPATQYYFVSINTTKGIPGGSGNCYRSCNNNTVWNIVGGTPNQVARSTGIAAYQAVDVLQNAYVAPGFDAGSTQPDGTALPTSLPYDGNGYPLTGDTSVHSVVQLLAGTYTTYADGQANNISGNATPGCYDLPDT